MSDMNNIDTITAVDAQPITRAMRQAMLQQLQAHPALQIHESISGATVAALEEALERAVELGLSFFYAVDGGVTELVNTFEEIAELKGVDLQELELEELTNG